MANRDYAVILSNVYKTFWTSQGPVHALQGVDLEVPAGEIFGFLGPNGAGKTTTLRILTTLLPSDRGEAVVAGVHVAESPKEVRKSIGYVSQKGGADRQATGWENLILQGRLYGMSKPGAQKQAQGLVDLFSLGDCIGRLVSTYSGGQRRRLDIALGMIHRPKILFLDEPTNGLDPQSRDDLWLKILALRENGTTIFLTSHYLDEIDALAAHLAIMDHGKIVATGSPDTLKKQISGDIITIGVQKDFHSRVLSLFEAEDIFVREITSGEKDLRFYVDEGEAALPYIFRLLEQAKIQLETIQMSTPSLNDVFLKKTGRFLREGEAL